MASESLNFLGAALPKAHLYLVLPLMLACWMAWIDIKTYRIPNYLTLGSALAGLAYQLWFQGWAGVADGFLGIGMGFAMLIFFYLRGGLGAGDVKVLAALGAWLGPLQTLYLFIYMAFSGVLIIVVVLWWRGLLWGKIRQVYSFLMIFILLRSYPPVLQSETTPPNPKRERIPYSLSMALGMAFLCWQKFYWH
jgi:prepilin peptidase CpaA